MSSFPPICGNSVYCTLKNCKRRHPFYTTFDDRIIIQNQIYKFHHSLSTHLIKFHNSPPNWCYDGVFCFNIDCPFHHTYDRDGILKIREICKNLPDINIPSD